MDANKLMKIPTCGGCMAKLSPGLLKEVVSQIPTFSDPNLLVGFDTSDDGAVYRLTPDIALIKTLDFFTPMVDDPYTFGKIAAANALSDIYAMGGKVSLALNIVCFPANDDPSILAAILKGGAEKVKEAGGILCGGHSINDREIKYGLSVTGIVHPNKILRNNTCKVGDKIILTKPLGVGMLTAAYQHGKVKQHHYEGAIHSMQTLNKYAFEIASRYNVNAATDVTGFGFLGHLNEMSSPDYTIVIDSESVPVLDGAYRLAWEHLVTGGAANNRHFLGDKVHIKDVEDMVEEMLFDPQTSGGLLLSVPANEAKQLIQDLSVLDLPSAIVGEVKPKADDVNIIVL